MNQFLGFDSCESLYSPFVFHSPLTITPPTPGQQYSENSIIVPLRDGIVYAENMQKKIITFNMNICSS